MTQSPDRLAWYHIAVNGFRGHTLLTPERAAKLAGRFSVVPIEPPDFTARIVPILMTIAKHANGADPEKGSEFDHSPVADGASIDQQPPISEFAMTKHAIQNIDHHRSGIPANSIPDFAKRRNQEVQA